jgi:hypothetical protein
MVEFEVDGRTGAGYLATPEGGHGPGLSSYMLGGD